MMVQTPTARCDSAFHSELPVSDFFAGNLSAYAPGQRGNFDAQVHLCIVKLLSFSPKKACYFLSSRLLEAEISYIVSMKLRSLSLRLGCLSLRSALASI